MMVQWRWKEALGFVARRTWSEAVTVLGFGIYVAHSVGHMLPRENREEMDSGMA